MKNYLLLLLIGVITTHTNLFSQSYLNDSLLAEQYTAKGDSCIVIDDFDNATYFFEKSIEKYWAIKDTNNYLWRFSALFYINQITGNHEEYLKYIHQVEMFDSYPEPYIWSYYRPLALIQKQFGNYEKATMYYKKALKEFKKLKVSEEIDIIQFYWGLSSSSMRQEDYEKALEYYAEIDNILYRNQSDSYFLMDLNFNKGVCYSKQKKYKTAIIFYKKSLNQDNQNSKYSKGIESLRLNILYHLSEDYRKLGDCNKAFSYLQEIKDTQLETHIIGSIVSNEIALTYECLNKPELAHKYFKKAIKIEKDKNRNKHLNISRVYKDFGDFHYRQAKLDTALQLYQKGIVSLLFNFNDTTDVFSNPKNLDDALGEQVLLDLLTKKAQTLTQLYHQNNDKKALEVSLETYQLATQLITLIRQGIQTEASKHFLAERVVEVHEGAIGTARLLEELTGEVKYKSIALNFAEQNKAMVLLEALKDQEAKSLYLPDSLLNKETDYKTQISFYEKNIYKEKNKGEKSDSTRIQEWESTVFDLKRKYEKFQDQLENQYPDYYNLKYQFEITELEDIQKKISDKTALIEYFVGDSTIYSFVITQQDLEIVESPIPDNFRKTIEDYRKSVGDYHFYSDSTEVAEKLYAESSAALYNWLLKESLTHLDNTIEEIIIVPDDALSLVNFEALKDQNNQYLIERFAVSYAYSATHLFNFSQSNNSKDKDITYGGFAPIYKTDQEEKKFELEESLAMRNFKTRGAFMDLPEARTAVQNIAQQLKGEFWLADQATEQNFKANAHKYDILHLAMHGVTDNQNPLYSKLIFTQEKKTGEDNYLNAYELYNMNLNAKLAVLSACNTGYGELKRGEGVMSMARAFAYSGCPSLVMSLWSVPSDETATIMTHFHNELKQGTAKNQALRLAKLKYLETAIPERKQPFFWAGFISIGDVSPVYQKSFDWTSWPVLLLIGLLGTIVLLEFFWKIKK